MEISTNNYGIARFVFCNGAANSKRKLRQSISPQRTYCTLVIVFADGKHTCPQAVNESPIEGTLPLTMKLLKFTPLIRKRVPFLVS